MILQTHNLSLLLLVLNLVFFCVCKFLKFSVVFNTKSIIIYNYTVASETSVTLDSLCFNFSDPY